MPWRLRIRDVYIGNMKKAQRIGKGANIKIAVCLQPMWIHKRHHEGKENAFTLAPIFSEYLNEQFDGIRQELTSFTAAMDDPDFIFLDMTQTFRDVTDEMFWDIIHTSNEGNRIVAREMADKLIAAGFHPPN